MRSRQNQKCIGKKGDINYGGRKKTVQESKLGGAEENLKQNNPFVDDGKGSFCT